MLVEALVALMATSFNAVMSLVPSWEPDTAAFNQTATSVGAMASSGNGYFPVRVLGICIALVLGLKIALMAWRAIVFIYSMLPFKAT